MKVELIRITNLPFYGMFGALTMDNVPFCVTLEPDDKNNARGISCIPADIYECRRITSPRFGYTFEVMNVPNRDHILFHAGNTSDHTHGCILLAQHYGKLKGKLAVLNSGNTFKAFMKIMKDVENFELVIRESI